MSKCLYLFVTSERPDPYVNAIAHCLEHTSVDRISFLHVRGTTASTSSGVDLSAVALRNVQIQIDRLSNGEYRHFDGDNAGQIVKLESAYSPSELAELRSFYERCLRKEVNWSHRQIAYATLREGLAAIVRTEPTSVFDVTSVSKSLLGDIVAVSILEGVETLYTLDLRTRPDFDEPWRMLLHDFRTSAGRGTERYAYVNILDTPVFRSCNKSILLRGPRLVFPLVAAFVLLGAALADYMVRGQVTTFIQITSLASAVASLLSLVFTLWPVRQ